jgi:oligoendopeptidase F
MNAPVKIDALPVWRLDDLYVGRNDPRIEEDLAEAKTANDALVALKGQFVAARADAAKLGALIDQGIRLYVQATNKLWSVGAYAGLATAVARDDAAWAKFEADVRVRASTIGAESLFFTLELNELEESEIQAALKAHPSAQRWRPWLRRVRLSRPHELTPDLERMVIDRAPAVGNWSRLFDETLSRLVIKAGKDKLTLPEALNRLSDPDPDRRKVAAKAIAAQLEQATPVLALSLNTLAFEKQVEDRWRKYSYPAQSRHLANEVDGEAVDAMEEAVVEAYPRLSHRYYAL